MLQRLFGMLVSGLVIFFPVVCGGGTVRVRGKFVELGSSLVRVIWHSLPYPWFTLHFRIIPFSRLSHKGQSPILLKRIRYSSGMVAAGGALSLHSSMAKSWFSGNSATSSLSCERATSAFFSRRATIASKIFANGRR
jgi:hypothetical protein